MFYTYAGSHANRTVPRVRMPPTSPEDLPTGVVDAAKWGEVVSRLQEQVVQLRHKLRSSKGETADVQAQLRDLSNKYSVAHRSFAKAMREKDDAAQRQRLELEERFNREMAEALRRAGAPDGSGGDAGSSAGAAPTPELLNTIESLHKRYAAAEKAWAAAKADAEEATRRATRELEARLAREKAALQSANVSLEERVGHLQQQLTVMMTDVSVAQQREAAATARAEELERESGEFQARAKELERELKRAVAAGGGGDAADGGGGDGPSSVPAAVFNSLKSTTDARIRTLSNEVQYLKAQISSELTCKEELGTSLAEVNRRFADAKRAWQKEQAELLDAKRAEVAKLLEEHARDLSRPRTEIANLEDKVVRLQMQVTDMAADVQAARKNEEEARHDASLARQAKAEAAAEAEALRGEVAALKEAQSEAAEDREMRGAIKSTADAAVRRAQNEATFLRTQLNSELRCKTELEDQLRDSNAKLMAETEARRRDVARLETEARELKRREGKKLALMQQDHISLQGEVQQLRQSLADATTSLERSRDQQRQLQAALEVKANSTARLEEELANAKKQSLAAQVAAGQAATRHQSSLAAAQAAVKEITAQKDKEIGELRWELSAKLSKVSETQRGMIDLRAQLEAGFRDRQRSQGAERLFRAVERWASHRRRTALQAWRVNVVVERRAAEQAKVHDLALLEARSSAQADKEKACRMLLTEFRENKKLAVARAQRQAAATQLELAGMAAADREGERLRALDAVAEERAAAARGVEAAVAAAEARAAAAAREAVQVAEARAASEARAMVERLTEERKAAIKKWEATTTQEVAAALAKAEEDKKAAVAAAVAKVHKDMSRVVHQGKHATRDAIRAAVAAARKDWQREAEVAQQQYQAAIDEAVKAEKARSMSALDALESKHRSTLESVMRQALGDREKLVREVLEDKAQAVAAAQEQARADIARLREERDRDFENFKAKTAAEAANTVAEALSAQRKAVEEAEAAGRAATAAAEARVREEMAAQAAEQVRTVRQATRRELLAVARQREAALAQASELAQMRAEDAYARADATARAAVAAAVAEAQADGEQRRQASIKHVHGEAAAHMAQLAAQLRLEGEQAVARAKADAEQELKRQLAAAEERRKAAVAAFMDEAKAQDAEHASATVAAIERAKEQARNEATARFQAQLEDVRHDHAQMVAELQRRAEEDKARSLEAVREQAAAEQTEAMEELRSESERLLESIEGAMARVMADKKATDAQLARTKSALEEAEDTVYDLETQVQRLTNSGKLQSVALLRQMLVYVNEIHKAKAGAEAAGKQAVADVEARLRREVALQARQAQLARDRMHQLESMREAMQETLMNHKREVLMEHKVLSTNIQTELASVEERKAEADKRCKAVLIQVSELEGRVRMLENELREHSKQSAIGADGTVNVNHTRKKKRLDGEVERAIERVTTKRDELNELQDTYVLAVWRCRHAGSMAGAGGGLQRSHGVWPRCVTV